MKILQLSALALVLAVANTAPAQTAENTQATPAGTINVNGEATIKVEADQVIIEIYSDHTDEDAQQAYRQTTDEMKKALDFLKSRQDVKDLKTTNVQLSARQDYQQKTTEYNARQSLTFKLTDVKAYDDLMLSLIKMGINGIGQVNFISSESEKYDEILMRQAVQNARKKAVILASELGQQVGKATMISDVNYNGPMPMREYKAAFSSMASVAPGSLELSAVVNVEFELK